MCRFRFFVCVGLMLLFLAGCSSAPANKLAVNNNTAGVPVSLSMTDDPPNGVTVLFFQISLTAAYLTPASGSNVSLLNNNTPIQVDVTQLQALSAFLSTANVPAGTYNSMTLTFASPQLVIFNLSDQSIASTCPVGTICQLNPQIDNSATLTFSSAPFPVTINEGSPLGFLLDFHLNNVIQSDLSVNLSAPNGVTIQQLPSTPVGPPQFGFLFGTVQSVNASQNQFTLRTGWGWTFTVEVNSSTTYQNFPSSACSAGGLSCLVTGDIVQVQVASVQSSGTLVATSVSYLQTASEQVVQGNIINLTTGSSGTVMTLLLHWSPSNGQFPTGGVASVTVPSTATFAIDSGTFTIPSGLNFASATDLIVGQQVQVEVQPGSVSNSGSKGPWSPPSVSFTANSVELEPSQITGMITAINSSGSSLTLTTLPSFYGPWYNSGWSNSNGSPVQITVETTSQTTYQNVTPDSFAGLSVNSMVSVQGWLFATASAATPSTQVAETIVGRANGNF